MIIERREKCVLGQIIRSCRILLVRALALLFECLDTLGEQAGEIELTTLIGWECRALVQVGRVEKGSTCQGAVNGTASAKREVAELRG